MIFEQEGFHSVSRKFSRLQDHIGDELSVWSGIFFCVQVIYVIVKIVTPCFNRLAFLAGPQWDSVLEINKILQSRKLFLSYFHSYVLLYCHSYMHNIQKFSSSQLHIHLHNPLLPVSLSYMSTRYKILHTCNKTLLTCSYGYRQCV